MRHALVVVSLASLLIAQDAEPRSARAILRDYDRVSMPSFSGGNDPERLRKFEVAIRNGSLQKAELALELFAAYPDHPRLPRVMATRWATFNNVTYDYPKVIVETSLLLEDEDARDDLARVALAARTRAITWSPLSTNRDRLEAARELFERDPGNEYTGVAMVEVAEHHLASPKAMRRLLEFAVEHFPESAWVAHPAKNWLRLLDNVGKSFPDELPVLLRERLADAVGEPVGFTVVQLWSGWVMTAESRREIAAVRALREEFGDDVRVVGLVQGDVEARLPAAKRAGVDWPQVSLATGQSGPGAEILRVSRTPCYFVLDRELEIVGITGGAAAAALRIRRLRE